VAVPGTPQMPPPDRLALATISFLFLLMGGAFAFLGSGILRKIAFPIVFLFFMAPLPTAALEWIEIALQHASADASHAILSLTGIPVHRQGLEFRLPGISIRVAQECSGFNSTYALFIVSLLAGHLFLRKRSHQAALALLVFPIAIVRNGLRISTIGVLCAKVDPNMINSVIHSRGGPLFFAISLVPFVLILWWFLRREARVQAPTIASSTVAKS